MSRIEVFSGIERRRRWSVEEKRRLVLAAFAPGAVVSAVARQADIHPNQLYRWRQDFLPASAEFAEVVVSRSLSSGGFSCTAPEAIATDLASDMSLTVIEVSFADRARLRLPVSTSPELAAAMIGALVRR